MSDPQYESTNHADDEIDLSELFTVLWQRKLLIIFISTVSLVLGVLFASTKPNIYQAQATVLLNGENRNNTITSVMPDVATNHIDFDTSIKLLTSHQFLAQLVSKLSIPAVFQKEQQGDSWGAEEIKQNLSIKQIAQTNLLEISFESVDANFSAQLVNTITTNFIAYKAQLLQPHIKNDDDWLSQKIAHIQAQLIKKEDRLNAFRHDNNAIDIANLVKLDQHEISLLFNEQRALNQEHELLLRLLSKVKRYNNDINRIVTITKIANIKIIKSLLQSLESLKAERSQVKLRYLHKHPKYQSISLKIDEAKRQMRGQVYYQIQQYKARLKDVVYLLKKIDSKQLTAKHNLEQSIIKAREFALINRELKAHLTLLEKLIARQKQLEILDNKSTIASFIVVDPARVPVQPIGPKRRLIAVLSVLLGSMLAIVLVLILHFVGNNRSRYRQIVISQGFNILGELPEIKGVTAEHPVLKGHGKNFKLYQESIHSIRTNFMTEPSLHSQRLIAITSLMPNEGKSSCCLQLTRSFSELERVIIVDADLRSPSIAAVLGQSPHRLGLTNFIAETHTLEQCIFHNEELNADVLSSGIQPTNALLFLTSKRFSLLLTVLLNRYDRVILECPPILSVSDALVIAKSVKGMTLVTDVTKSTTAKFMHDMHELQHTNIEISGVILNRTKNDSRQYYGAYSQQTLTNLKDCS